MSEQVFCLCTVQPKLQEIATLFVDWSVQNGIQILGFAPAVFQLKVFQPSFDQQFWSSLWSRGQKPFFLPFSSLDSCWIVFLKCRERKAAPLTNSSYTREEIYADHGRQRPCTRNYSSTPHLRNYQPSIVLGSMLFLQKAMGSVLCSFSKEGWERFMPEVLKSCF